MSRSRRPPTSACGGRPRQLGEADIDAPGAHGCTGAADVTASANFAPSCMHAVGLFFFWLELSFVNHWGAADHVWVSGCYLGAIRTLVCAVLHVLSAGMRAVGFNVILPCVGVCQTGVTHRFPFVCTTSPAVHVQGVCSHMP